MSQLKVISNVDTAGNAVVRKGQRWLVIVLYSATSKTRLAFTCYQRQKGSTGARLGKPWKVLFIGLRLTRWTLG